MMTQSEQTAFIKNGFEALYRELEAQAPFSLWMSAVPEAMRATPEYGEGWSQWKLVPSPVTAADLDALERELGCTLPSLVRTFLSTYCHAFFDTDLGSQPVNKPFQTIRNAWNPDLVRGGFLPFAWDVNGGFIRCIDLTNLPDEDHCPVVEIDHDALFSLEGAIGREDLLPLMRPMAESFQAFLEEIFSGWTDIQSRRLAREYIRGLQDAYKDADAGAVWAEFAAIKTGVSEQDLAALKALYPELPASLETLLRFADGTCWREYRKGEKTCLFFLGSDIEGCPYSLLSAEQMRKTKDDFAGWGDYLIRREYDSIPVDERITEDLDGLHWLHFADCMNNGGTSQLFLDFSPSERGHFGQVLRYLHDPDELAVIAKSFDGYLELLMENEYDFIDGDMIEE